MKVPAEIRYEGNTEKAKRYRKIVELYISEFARITIQGPRKIQQAKQVRDLIVAEQSFCIIQLGHGTILAIIVVPWNRKEIEDKRITDYREYIYLWFLTGDPGYYTYIMSIIDATTGITINPSSIDPEVTFTFPCDYGDSTFSGSSETVYNWIQRKFNLVNNPYAYQISTGHISRSATLDWYWLDEGEMSSVEDGDQEYSEYDIYFDIYYYTNEQGYQIPDSFVIEPHLTSDSPYTFSEGSNVSSAHYWNFDTASVDDADDTASGVMAISPTMSQFPVLDNYWYANFATYFYRMHTSENMDFALARVQLTLKFGAAYEYTFILGNAAQAIYDYYVPWYALGETPWMRKYENYATLPAGEYKQYYWDRLNLDEEGNPTKHEITSENPGYLDDRAVICRLVHGYSKLFGLNLRRFYESTSLSVELDVPIVPRYIFCPYLVGYEKIDPIQVANQVGPYKVNPISYDELPFSKLFGQTMDPVVLANLTASLEAYGNALSNFTLTAAYIQDYLPEQYGMQMLTIK